MSAQQHGNQKTQDAALSRREAIAAGAVGSLLVGTALSDGIAMPQPALAGQASPVQQAAAAVSGEGSGASKSADRIELGHSGSYNQPAQAA